MTRRSSQFVAGCSVLALLAIGSTQARADDAAPAAQPSSNTSTVEEVVVTARFRKEGAQNAPTAITAISGAGLSARNLTNVQDLGAAVPNAFIAPPTAATGASAYISMRGVSQSDFNFAFEPGVGVYIDDVYHPTLMGSALDLMDVDHVEVLRGPQGTLFGKNSMGGAIRLFSKEPRGDNSGYLEGTIGSYDRLDFKGAFDTALIPDKLFLRVSAAEKHVKGYVNLLDFACDMKRRGTSNLIPAGISANPSAGPSCSTGREGGEDLKAGRMMLRYIASPKLEFGLTGDVTYDDREANPDVLIDTVPAAQLPSLIPSIAPWNGNLANGPTPVYDSRFVPPNHYSSYANITTGNTSSIHEWGVSGSGKYQITSDIQAKAVLAYREFSSDFSYNPDASPYGFGENSNPITRDQFSAELQVTGQALDKKLDWATGLYYFDANTHLGGHIIYTSLNFDQDDHYTDKSKSAFIHGVYHVTDALSLTVGARYSDVSKGYTFHHPGITDQSFSQAAKESRWDWLVNLDYKITPDISIYGQVATGFRPGGVNPRPIIVPDQLVSFKGEELTSFEGGIKTKLFHNRVIFNLAGFYSDYSSHLSQSTVFECLATKAVTFTGPGSCPVGGAAPWFYYFNDKAEVHGIEAELDAEPIDNLHVNASLGWNGAKSLVTDKTAPNYRDPSNLFQPEWNISGGGEYRFDLGGHGSLTPRLDVVYQSKMTFNGNLASPATAEVTAAARTVVNGKITYVSPDRNWSVSLSGTNLFDQFYWYNKFALNGFAISGVPSRPQEWSVTVRRDF